MQLGFDAKRLFNNFTGLGNYSRTLLRDLSERAPDNMYHLFSPKTPRNQETAFFLDNPSFQVVTPERGRKFLWRTLGMKRAIQHQKLDLYHGLSHELPVGIRKTGVPSVVTIHDLIFRHYPQQYRRWDNYIYDKKFSYACQNAHAVVAISESTKQDIRHFYGTPEDKIHVIYQSCDERFLLQRPASVKAEVRKRYDLPTAFSLYVGSLIERKNLLGIVESLGRLPANLQHPLVIVGNGKEEYRRRVEQRAKELNVGHLLFFRSIKFSDLPTVYQCAKVFLYPSFYEGFGIPVIEALNSGVPVITSNRSSLPEAAGPESLLVDPSSAEAITAAWEKLLVDDELVARLRKAGYAHAERFQADVVVPKMLRLYKKIQ